ncbi:hypothetical protein K377_05685 [Streptomyces sp. PsTaAH-137]|nr:hypothetical protein K377_05685 [Streptomyces sp. PsTaAH-137]
MALMFSREQVSQKWRRTPSSTEYVQVRGVASAVVPQRAHTRVRWSGRRAESPSGRDVTRRR